MRRILFLMPSFVGGGAERVFTTLIRHLDRNKFELHLGVLQSQGAYAGDIPGHVFLHDLNVNRVRYAPIAISRLIWRVRPDTVISTLGHLNVALCMVKPILPRHTRIVIREAILASALMREETPYPRFWIWLYRHFYRRADHVICLSTSMVKDMQDSFGLSRDRLVRIFNPIDMERIRSATAGTPSPYSDPGPHLVAVGRLSKQKGFDILLDAMRIVVDAVPSARLTILGEGPLREALLQRAEQLGVSQQVDFLGFAMNPWPYLKHADLFVLSSRYEGLPNAMLEALALGTPCVATDCPGAVGELRSLISGITLVPVEDSQALAAGVISNSQSSESRAYPKPEQMHHFDLKQIIDEYAKLL